MNKGELVDAVASKASPTTAIEPRLRHALLPCKAIVLLAITLFPISLTAPLPDIALHTAQRLCPVIQSCAFYGNEKVLSKAAQRRKRV